MFSQWINLFVKISNISTEAELLITMNNVIAPDHCNNYVVKDIDNCANNGVDFFDN